MKKQKSLAAVIALSIFVAGIGTVVAADAKRVFAGKVVLLNKVPPTYFNTKNGFVQFLKKHKIKTLHANKDNEWVFRSMVFFKKPLGDYEVNMLFYDVTDGKSKDKRVFKDSFTQYTQDRSARSLMGQAVLTRPRFDANRKYVVEVQSHGKTVATGYFETKGISQAQLDEQARIETEQKRMEKEMEELKKKAKEQEEAEKNAEKNKNKSAGDDLF